MGKRLANAIAVVTLCILSSQTGYSASWVESSHGGISIQHPQGWDTVWEEAGVEVSHPDNPMIWCAFATLRWQGTAQQFITALLDDYRNKLQDLRVLEKKRISEKPDTYGVRFTYDGDGITMGSLVLVTTGNRKNFSVRSYAAPIQDYDRMKLVLIPILLSLKFEQAEPAKGRAARGATKLIQVLGSPSGYWQMRAPRGWRSIDVGEDESIEARCVGPNGEAVGVVFLCGLVRSHILRMRMAGGNVPLMSIPYLTAADLFERVLLPYHQTEFPDM
ncbi:MAG: hypothetical protein JRH07_05380 [Deltaproteobacteria bacterium]|nr:hypothetical protein [Deltaproteobacteria bacterium]